MTEIGCNLSIQIKRGLNSQVDHFSLLMCVFIWQYRLILLLTIQAMPSQTLFLPSVDDIADNDAFNAYLSLLAITSTGLCFSIAILVCVFKCANALNHFVSNVSHGPLR